MRKNENRYVVYWDGYGTNTHHYFSTYEEAKKFVVNNDIKNANVAYLMAYCKTDFIELDKTP